MLQAWLEMFSLILFRNVWISEKAIHARQNLKPFRVIFIPDFGKVAFTFKD